jgi:nucleotide-binding universal stress UspA family protein
MTQRWRTTRRVLRRILHPSDLSPASRSAFRTALALATRDGATLLVVHVLPVLPLVPDAYLASTTYGAVLQAQRTEAQERLDRLVGEAKRAGARASSILLDFGVTAERITRLARARRADVIVMGTHGRSGLRRAVLGSVAARVVATATCPVLTVRG